MSFIINVRLEVDCETVGEAREEAQRLIQRLRIMDDIEYPQNEEQGTDDDIDEIF